MFSYPNLVVLISHYCFPPTASHCYRYMNGRDKSYDEAKKDCAKVKGGTLAVIHNQLEEGMTFLNDNLIGKLVLICQASSNYSFQ